MGRRTRSKGVYKGRVGKTPPTPKKNLNDDPVYDAVDHFMKGSDEIRFNNDSSEDDQFTNISTDTHVLQLASEKNYESSSDSYDDLSDSSEDEEEILRKQKREQKLEEKYEDWGRFGGKNKYHYTDNTTNNEEYETAIQEEEEAKYLQEKQISNLQEDDFAIEEDDDDNNDDSSDAYWDEADQKEKFELAAKSIANVSLLPNQKVKKKTKEKQSLNNKSKLSKNDKLDIVTKDSPELLGLLKDFDQKLKDLKNNVQPLLTEVTKKQLPTSDGISFLEVKFHLLLNYCMNIGFYMLMKAEGKQVEDHPVISQLVKLRLLLDKIKPIDEKLHYQIQKLLKMSSDGISSDKMEDGLHHKPNIDSLDQNNSDSDNDDQQSNSGVYKLKKVAPVAYEDKSSKRNKKKKVKSGTSMTEFIREEFSEAPREINYSGKPKLTTEQKYEMEFEEDNFMRLKQQAKVRRKQEKQVLQRSELEDPLDFRDITGFGLSDDENDYTSNRSKLNDIIQNVERDNSNIHGNTEIDLPYKTWDKRKPLSKRTLEEFRQDSSEEYINNNIDNDDIMQDISEDDYYEEVKQVKKKRKLTHDSDDYKPKYSDNTIEENKKRSLTYQIEQNKGLMPYRSKKKRNPRKANRIKAERLNKKAKQAGYLNNRDQSKPYSGESSGIRKGIVKSRNLNKK